MSSAVGSREKKHAASGETTVQTKECKTQGTLRERWVTNIGLV